MELVKLLFTCMHRLEFYAFSLIFAYWVTSIRSPSMIHKLIMFQLC